jgi:hypothetical protein
MKLALAAALALLSAGAVAPAQAQPAAPDYTPLRLYNGQWRVTPKDASGQSKPVVLTDTCNQAGVFYVCQQTVGQTVGGLIVFAPAGAAGKWKTQFIALNGASGTQPGDLDIEDQLWTFTSREETSGGGALYTRVINRFSGSDQIHFEKSTSPDGSTWTIQLEGDEVRIR